MTLKIVDEDLLRADIAGDLRELSEIHYVLSREYGDLAQRIGTGEADIEEFIRSAADHGVPMIEGQGIDMAKLRPRETKTLRNPRSHTPIAFDYPIHRRRYVRSHTKNQHRFREKFPDEPDQMILHFPAYMPGVVI